MPKNTSLNLSYLLCLLFLSSSLAAPAKVLNGGVQEQDQLKMQPLMNRNDINKGNADPFAGNAQQDQPMQAIDAPAAAFAVPSNQPPPPSQMFPLNAQDGGNPQFQNQNPAADMTPQQQPAFQPQQGGTQTNGNPNDPDANSQALQLAWDQWHHNVAQAVYQRYTTASNLAFSKSPPLSVSVSYTVTRDCQIQNIRLTQKSPNLLFNMLIMTVLKSLNGDSALLTFPQGSHRMSVEKAGTFSVNYGIEGFKYLTGDKETLRR
ncbi:unnamed protein product [Sphagnum jensenii]